MDYDIAYMIIMILIDWRVKLGEEGCFPVFFADKMYYYTTWEKWVAQQNIIFVFGSVIYRSSTMHLYNIIILWCIRVRCWKNNTFGYSYNLGVYRSSISIIWYAFFFEARR